MKFATKLILSVIIAAIVAVPLLSLSVFYQTSAILKEQILANQLKSGNDIMNNIDRVLYRAYQDVRLIAENEILENFFDTEQPSEQEITEVVNETIEEAAILTGPWDALMVVDKEGVIVASMYKDNIGKNIREYSRKRAAFYQAVKGKVYYSDLVISEITGRPTVIFSAPIADSKTNKAKGVVIGHFAWPVVMQVLDEIPYPSYVHLFNRDGIVIAAQTEDRDEILVLTLMNINLVKRTIIEGRAVSDIAVVTHEETQPMLATCVLQKGYLGYKGSNWGLMIATPLSVAFTPINKMAVNIGILAAVIMIMLVGFLYSIARIFTRPLEDLTKTVQLIGDGDLSAKAKVKTKDEIGVLAASFNKMTEDLQRTTVSRDYVDNIISSMIDTLIVLDPDGYIKTVNKATSELLGYAEDELIGTQIATILEEEEEEEELFKGTRLRKLIKEGLVREYDLTYRTKSGEKIPVSFSGSVMRTISCPNDKPSVDCPAFKKKGSHCDKIVGIVGIARDMRERKKYELKLQNSAEEQQVINKKLTKTYNELISSKKRYSEIITNMNDGVAVYKPSSDAKDFIIKDINKAGLKISLTTRDEAIGRKLTDVFPAIKKMGLLEVFLRVNKTSKSEYYPATEYSETGISYWVDNFVYKLPSGELISIYKDVTDQKQYERKLQNSTEELQDANNSLGKREAELMKQKDELEIILDSSPAWIFYKDTKNKFIRVNKAFADVCDMSTTDLEGKSAYDIFPREQADAYWKDDNEVIASGKPKLNIIEPSETNKGTLWVQTDKIPYYDQQGNIIGIVGFAVDITDLKKAQEEAKKTAVVLAIAEVEKKKTKELETINIKLKKKSSLLEKFQNLTIGREEDMVNLKEEINSMLIKAGKSVKYPEVEEIRKRSKP